MPFTISSPAFADGAAIPARFSCEGDDVSAGLTWTGAPAGTRSFTLIVDDPDAPDPRAPRTTWVHWVLYNLPPTVASLPEAVTVLPAGALEGTNDWKRTGYGGPCPPVGRHRYFHKVYALDVMLPDLGAPDRARVEEAMKGHVLAEARTMGTYEKASAKG
jgi:Raf kinase inhibitor-like YbhB/YbcL family protein